MLRLLDDTHWNLSLWEPWWDTGQEVPHSRDTELPTLTDEEHRGPPAPEAVTYWAPTWLVLSFLGHRGPGWLQTHLLQVLLEQHGSLALLLQPALRFQKLPAALLHPGVRHTRTPCGQVPPYPVLGSRSGAHTTEVGSLPPLS